MSIYNYSSPNFFFLFPGKNLSLSSPIKLALLTPNQNSTKNNFHMHYHALPPTSACGSPSCFLVYIFSSRSEGTSYEVVLEDVCYPTDTERDH